MAITPRLIGNVSLELLADDIDFDLDYIGVGSAANQGKTGKCHPSEFLDAVADRLPTLTHKTEQTLLTEGQTVIVVSEYVPSVGAVAVFLNGSKLRSGLDFYETDAQHITLGEAGRGGDIVEVVIGHAFDVTIARTSKHVQNITGLTGSGNNSTALTTNRTYTINTGEVDVYFNGALLTTGTDYTETNGTTITLLFDLVPTDQVQIIYGQVTDILTVDEQDVGQALYPQTAAEIAAGITPTDFRYPVGYVLRYGSNSVPGTTDMTTSIRNAILLRGAGSEVTIPPGQNLTTETISLPTGIRIKGVLRGTLDADARGSVILFRPSGSDTVAFRNESLANDILLQDIQIDCDDYSVSGMSFDTTSSIVLRNIGFDGNFDIGVHVGAGDVLDFDQLTFFHCGLKRAAIYIGGGNAITIRKLHTSGISIETPASDTVFGVAAGAVATLTEMTLHDCIFQGLTIGVSLARANNVVIENPYFEETLCNVRTGDLTIAVDSRGVILRGGNYSSTSLHSQHASRGPLVYLPYARTVTLDTLNFQNSVEDDASIQPIFCDVTTTNVVVINPYFYDSGVPAGGALRTNLFMQSSGSPSPSITAIGIPYGSYGAHELILKKDGAYGGTSYGIRIDNAGAVTTSAFTPPTHAAPNALITAAMPVLATI
jgi:hypothetical protein